MGIPGWRIFFHLVGIIRVLVDFLVRFVANDPRYLGNKTDKEKDQLRLKSFKEEISELLKEAKAIING